MSGRFRIDLSITAGGFCGSARRFPTVVKHSGADANGNQRVSGRVCCGVSRRHVDRTVNDHFRPGTRGSCTRDDLLVRTAGRLRFSRSEIASAGDIVSENSIWRLSDHGKANVRAAPVSFCAGLEGMALTARSRLVVALVEISLKSACRHHKGSPCQ